MAGSETVYTIVIRGTAFFERGRSTVSALPVERDGAIVAPDEDDSSYQLLDPSGTVIAEPTIELNDDDIAEVTIDAEDLPDTLPLGVGYQERWTLALPDDSIRAVRREVVLGLFELQPMVSHQDFLDDYPDILEDLGGFGTSLQPFMDAGWREVTRTIVRQGEFPDIICEPSDVYDWYQQVVWERVFRMLMKTQASNERWKELWTHHLAQKATTREAVRFLADRDRDGRADSQGREGIAKAYHMNVPHTRRRLWDPRW